MWNEFAPKILIGLFAIVLIECVVLSPNPKPIIEPKMGWVEEPDLDANGDFIYLEDGNHYRTHKVWKALPYEKSGDPNPFLTHPPRDLIWGVMCIVSVCGGWMCYGVFIFIIICLAQGGFLPADVPATHTCLYMGLLPVMFVIAGIFCLTQRK